VELTGLLDAVGAAFARHRIPFMVVGGVAVSSWAEPRLTRDVDMVVLASKRDRPRLRQALIEAGARPTSTDLRVLYERRWIRLRTPGPRLDVHLAVSPHDREALRNAVVSQVGESRLPIASVEDLILYKLAAGREQNLADIDALLRSVKSVDRNYVDQWTGPLGERHDAPVAARWKAALERAAGR
jgi:hypothetical protein